MKTALSPTAQAIQGVSHYENFPVASFLCPPRLRPAIAAIYWFARTADDIADEGDAAPQTRLDDLAAYRADLLATVAGLPPSTRWSAVFAQLGPAITQYALPVELLTDLLSAFEQDVVKPRYASQAELLDYCRRSANPVGRLLLHLYGMNDAEALIESDCICSALQLINFWQDPSVDLPRGRHYVPAADAQRHGLSLDQLAQQAQLADSPASQALLRELCHWAGALMAEGAPLACRVPGRLGWELRLVVQGGLRILERIAAMHYRTLRQRPTLGASDFPVLLWRALRMRPARPTPGFRLA